MLTMEERLQRQLTDQDLAIIEQGQQLTNQDLRFLELEEKINE